MKLNNLIVFVFCVGLSIFLTGCSRTRQGNPHLLVFTKTPAHQPVSVTEGIAAIQRMGEENDFEVDTSSDTRIFTEDSLKKYSAIIFLNTGGNVLDHYQRADFQRYIQAGGGFVGVHSKTDNNSHWPWFEKLIGADFETDSAAFHTDSAALHRFVTRHHQYDGGRAFYAHVADSGESYAAPEFMEVLLEGIRYAIGKNETLNYRKAHSLRVPEEDRFSKEILGRGLDQPVEIAVLPDLGVLIAEHAGAIKYFDPQTREITVVAQLEVYHKADFPGEWGIGGNIEMGLMGLQCDPDFKKNNWVYAYYSVVGKSVDRLSRFKFQNKRFDTESEQIILEVPTERYYPMAHTGGSIAFDAHHNLYLSTGDNTNPFFVWDTINGRNHPFTFLGFAPLDDRPGYEGGDGRRAPGNTNDLRGKILRIRVNQDGTYNIPEGNLFAKGTEKARPEIYVMGTRNPYRISVDQRTGYLYWGEVGPDAGSDRLDTRGPRGYDEVNQARKAGNFGWPYFVGNNYPYYEYDFATGVSGLRFDPLIPLNNSRNNTGLKELPPAEPAFIWYPYAKSPEFPLLGQGGRTAMAGPVYYADDYPSATRYPDYYTDKLFIYEWMRDWIMVVTMDEEGDLQTIEPFMPHTQFYGPVDMETGKDGRIYLLEYGKGWYTKNEEAALSVITYNGGNRPPVAHLEVPEAAGATPLTIQASAAGSTDPDGDPLVYAWDFGDGQKLVTDTHAVIHTYVHSGTYNLSVTVSDRKGGETQSRVISVLAGNSRPQVSIQFEGNPVFFFPNKPIAYQVSVSDREDGHAEDAGFDRSRMMIRAEFLESPDKAVLSGGHLAAIEATLSVKDLMTSLNCMSCHKINERSVGPDFQSVAEKYKGDPKAPDYLRQKIIKGGNGVWGNVSMPAHPDLGQADAEKLANWILSLNEEKAKERSLSLTGEIATKPQRLSPQNRFYMSAFYIDRGADGVPSLSGSAEATLRYPLLRASEAETSPGVSGGSTGNRHFKKINTDTGWLKFSQISLHEVSSIRVRYSTGEGIGNWKLELRAGGVQGSLLGSTIVEMGVSASRSGEAVMQLVQPVNRALTDVYLVVTRKDLGAPPEFDIYSLLLEAL